MNSKEPIVISQMNYLSHFRCKLALSTTHRNTVRSNKNKIATLIHKYFTCNIANEYRKPLCLLK